MASSQRHYSRTEPKDIQSARSLFITLGIVLSPLTWFFLLRWLFNGMIGRFGLGRSSIYNMDHARLNVALPPKTMWMNMGYWPEKPQVSIVESGHPSAAFPDACRALLEQVLAFAGFTISKDQVASARPRIASPNPRKQLRILDAGTGCADQSLYLLAAQQSGSVPLLDAYVGITAEASQAALGKKRVISQLQRDNQTQRDVTMLHADAAAPCTWRSIDAQLAPSPKDAETWLLGLDSLYHMRPSRTPLLRHAARTLGAHLMAFDLLLSPDATRAERLLMRLLCPLLGVPFCNLMTPAQYEAALRSAGYAVDGMRMRDISARVFPGLSSFLATQDEELAACGLGGLGRLKAAKWLFGWWARSGTVRGYLIVARADARE